MKHLTASASQQPNYLHISTENIYTQIGTYQYMYISSTPHRQETHKTIKQPHFKRKKKLKSTSTALQGQVKQKSKYKTSLNMDRYLSSLKELWHQ